MPPIIHHTASRQVTWADKTLVLQENSPITQKQNLRRARGKRGVREGIGMSLYTVNEVGLHSA